MTSVEAAEGGGGRVRFCQICSPPIRRFRTAAPLRIVRFRRLSVDAEVAVESEAGTPIDDNSEQDADVVGGVFAGIIADRYHEDAFRDTVIDRIRRMAMTVTP